MEEFRNEVSAMTTDDISLILEDQLELYSPEEIQILKEELKKRIEQSGNLPENISSLVKSELKYKEKEKQAAALAAAELERKKQEAAARAEENIKRQNRKKIERLRESGAEGYYEYRVLTTCDSNSGDIDPRDLESLLNDAARDGWHLKCAYANEMGRNSSSSGVGGYTTGTNSTIDQHLLIMERFVKF